MRGMLIGTSGRYEGWTFPITDSRVTIGRENDNSLVIKDERVSRYHAEIRVFDDIYILNDLKSRNGTFVNQERIETPREIHGNDILLFGKTTFRFVLENVTQPEQLGPIPAVSDVAAYASSEPSSPPLPGNDPNAPTALRMPSIPQASLQPSPPMSGPADVLWSEPAPASSYAPDYPEAPEPARSNRITWILTALTLLFACSAFLICGIAAVVFLQTH